MHQIHLGHHKQTTEYRISSKNSSEIINSNLSRRKIRGKIAKFGPDALECRIIRSIGSSSVSNSLGTRTKNGYCLLMSSGLYARAWSRPLCVGTMFTKKSGSHTLAELSSLCRRAVSPMEFCLEKITISIFCRRLYAR